MGVEADRLCDVKELDHIEASLTLFVFGDERLRPAKPGGDISLGQLRGLPLRQQQGAKSFVFPREERTRHASLRYLTVLDDA